MLPAIPEPPRSKKFGMFVLPSWPHREQCHEGRLYHELIENRQVSAVSDKGKPAPGRHSEKADGPDYIED
jgi:hypothetical protein